MDKLNEGGGQGYVATVPILGTVENAGRRKAPLPDRLISSAEDDVEEIYSSDGVLITSQPLISPEIAKAADKLKSNPKMRVWTDDYNNLFQILKKKRFWK